MKKIWKGKNEKSQKRETVGAVTHKHNLKDTVGAMFGRVPERHDTTMPFKDNSANGNNKIKNKRTYRYMPLFVVLVLINIIAVICVGAPFGRPQENAEISKDVETNKEEILAETVQAGETYTVPEDGIYKIELHGGKGEGTKRTVMVVRLLDI